MGKSQRDKGYRGEHEVEQILRSHGINAKRGLVFLKQPDIITDTPLHIEVKRTEKTAIWDWMKQSREQSRGLIPSVVFRRSRDKWLICMELEDFLRLYQGEQEDG